MRSDFLASVAVVSEQGPSVTIPRLKELVAALAATFEYYEVVYVVSEQSRGELDGLARQISALPNLRIILTSEGTLFNRQRLLAALESIGDVVAIYDLDELAPDALARQLCASKDRNEILMGWRRPRPPAGWSYRLLSVASRHVITAQAARSIILPRELLNAILSRKSASLDLRFEARSPVARYQHFDVERPARRSNLWRRYELLMEILLAGAPRYLKAYAGFGFLVVLGSIFYLVYAFAIYLLRGHVQEGWLSTAITQAGSTAFIAGGMSILSIALTAMLEAQNGGNERMIVDEISNTSYFSKVTGRNVELSGETVVALPAETSPHVG